PVIPLTDAAGRVGTAVRADIDKEVPKLNVGVIFGLTVTLNVVVVAHCPAVGVNVYVAEFWLSTVEGFHVPVIPFVDVFGRAGTVPLPQIVRLVPKLNARVSFGLTVTINVVV